MLGLHRRELIRLLNKNLLHSIFVSLSRTHLNAILQRRAGDSTLETEARTLNYFENYKEIPMYTPYTITEIMMNNMKNTRSIFVDTLCHV